MNRQLAATAILLAWAACANAAIDAAIAYTALEGNADNLYVANEDGSSRFIVFKSTKSRLGAIDMAPVDPLAPTIRRLAFTQDGVLKVVRFRINASSVTVLDVTTLDAAGAPYRGAAYPDFSPDGSELLYTKSTSNGTASTAEVYLVPAAGGPAKVVWTAALSGGFLIHTVRWTGPDRFAFLLYAGDWMQSVQQATLDVNNDVAAPPETVFTDEDPFFLANFLFGIEEFDVAHTRAALLFTTGTPPGSTVRTLVEYTMPADGVAGSFTIHRANAGGRRAHFSSTDRYVVYQQISTRFTNVYEYIGRYDTVAPNGVVRIAGKGSFGHSDARP